MAIWYVDNLNGSDTTGNGTIVTPYKTILKATQIGVDNDVVRVAGSGWTNLSGTLTFTKGSASITTSVNLTGELSPGSIFTITDPTWGTEIWVWKVFSITATTIVVSAVTQVGNITVNAKKMTNINYYTTTASVTHDSIAKNGIEVQGGWINGFTEQTGLTAMVYHGTTAAAVSGTGIASVPLNTYINRFLFVNLSNGVGGSVNNWYPGNLWNSFVSSPSGASPLPHPTYTKPNLYLTHSFVSNQQTSLQSNNKPAYQVNSVYYTIIGNATITQGCIECNILYVKSNGVTLGQAAGHIIPSLNMIIGKLVVDFCLTSGADECVVLIVNNNVSSLLIRDMEYVGTNATSGKMFIRGRFGNYSFSNLQILLPSPKIIDDFNLIGLGNDNGYFNFCGPNIHVKDTEGTKLLLGSGQIIFSDPTVFDTGTNSLRITRQPVNTTPASQVPISNFYSTGISQTITFRAKSQVNATITFGLIGNAAYANVTSTSGFSSTQSFNLTTSWETFTYTGLQVANVYNLFSGTNVIFGVSNLPSAWGTSKYIWIDSVTVS